jgi:hypothetical protein
MTSAVPATVSTRRPLLVFVQDGIATGLGCLAEPLCNLCRGCEIEPRHLVRLHSAELDETEHRAVTMLFQPKIDGTVIIRFLPALFGGLCQVTLCQSPSPVLASLYGYLQKTVSFGNDEVVFRLVSAILYRDVEAASRELSRSNRLGRDGNMPGGWLALKGLFRAA